MLIKNFPKVFFSIICISPLFLSTGCAARDKLYYAAPSLLPHTTREMKSPGFWISRNPSPDRIVMNSSQITAFNNHTANDLKLTKDINHAASFYPGDDLKSELWGQIVKLSQRGYYGEDGHKVLSKFFDELHKKMNLDAIPAQIPARYGFIVHYADERIFPTQQSLYAKARDIDFDELQNSTLDAGTPVLVLHESKDGQWVYVLSRASGGWVLKENVARCGLAEWKAFSEAAPFVIITSAKADIYLDPAMTQYYDYVRMGGRFPLAQKNKDRRQIQIPVRSEDGQTEIKTAYLKFQDAQEGYLPYTPRTMIEQAFRLLNAPYGWGGMYGEQDCSAFLQEIFSTVGIVLPRNSSAQAKVGQSLVQLTGKISELERNDNLKRARGGITILPLKGHIMLYLGMVDNRPYAIHAVWAYREGLKVHDRARVINRVAVTDLFLGEGSQKGSLLDRLTGVNEILN